MNNLSTISELFFLLKTTVFLNNSILDRPLPRANLTRWMLHSGGQKDFFYNNVQTIEQTALRWFLKKDF